LPTSDLENDFYFSCICSHPLPSQCDLYYVNRDTLFSYHKDSELFLQVIIVDFTTYVLFATYILLIRH